MSKPLQIEAASRQRDQQLRVRAELAETRLSEVLSNMPLAYIAVDQDWRIAVANRQAARVAPELSEDSLGKDVWIRWPALAGTESARQFRHVMHERVPARCEYFSPACGDSFELNIQPTAEGIGVYCEDLTKHQLADAALQHNERHSHERTREKAEHQRLELETVYRTSPIGLALFDPVEFRYLNLNDRQAEIVGLPIEEILGKTVTEIAPIQGLREMFQQVAAGQPITNMLLEGELPMRPGVHRYWTVNYSPVYAPDGSVRAISAASLEITNQKRAEMALIQSEKLAAVGRLASSISHEINNPLESVTNLLYLAATNSHLPADVRLFLRGAQEELARVSQITTQSLRFHRQTMKPTRVGAADLMNSVLDLYQGRLLNSGIRVEPRYSSVERVECFESDIRQVLNNLIANAIDAMRRGGRLLLRTHDATDWRTGRKGVRLTVADTGHGMSAEIKEQAFEVFFTTKELNGTGLGLWISQGIAARHQGRLVVRSCDKPGSSGTVFTLFLPQNVGFNPPA